MILLDLHRQSSILQVSSDKLKEDTLKDRLDWNRETAFNLNRMEPDRNGFVYHPLFAEETFYEETDCEYPQEVTKIVFNSKTLVPRHILLEIVLILD